MRMPVGAGVFCLGCWWCVFFGAAFDVGGGGRGRERPIWLLCNFYAVAEAAFELSELIESAESTDKNLQGMEFA